MRYLIIIFWLWLTTCSLAQEWKAIDFKKWASTEDSVTFQCRIGGALQNYPDSDTSWAEIENEWTVIGDTIIARNCLMKTDVSLDGISRISIEYKDTTYVITQRPVKLIWLKMSNWKWVDIEDDPVWNTPSVDSNVVEWLDVFPAVDYRITKRKARVDHGIFFRPAFLDFAVGLYNERSDSLDIALGNVMEYTLSANIENADIGIGNVNKRMLKQMGRNIFGFAEARLHFPGCDTLPSYKVNHRWIKKANKVYCVEFIEMSKIKAIHETYPLATIWHNASPHTISGTTNLDDTWIDGGGGQTGKNFGGGTTIYTNEDESNRGLVRCKNVASELGGSVLDITDCTLYMRKAGIGSADSVISAIRIFKPWVEGTQNGGKDPPGVTWVDWDNDDWEWATAGCENADDGGSDNSGDGSGADRKVTVEDTETLIDATGFIDLTMTDALAEGWYAGTINEEGVIIIGCNETVIFQTSEHPTSEYQPYWIFTYTEGEKTSQVIIIE